MLTDKQRQLLMLLTNLTKEGKIMWKYGKGGYIYQGTRNEFLIRQEYGGISGLQILSIVVTTYLHAPLPYNSECAWYISSVDIAEQKEKFSYLSDLYKEVQIKIDDASNQLLDTVINNLLQ